jgi:hypothetical protein
MNRCCPSCYNNHLVLGLSLHLFHIYWYLRQIDHREMYSQFMLITICIPFPKPGNRTSKNFLYK